MEFVNIKKFSELLKEIDSVKEIERKEYIAREYIEKLRNKNIFTPLIERDDCAIFLYYGEPFTDVRIVGDFTNWRKSYKFNSVSGVPLYFLPVRFPEDARIEYKLIVNGREIFDPLNDRKIDNGIGGLNSYFTMPKYYDNPSKYYNPNIPHGKIEKLYLYSDTLKGSREVLVYLPPNYDPSNKYPSIYLNDGIEYIYRAGFSNTLDYQISKGEMEPVIAIFLKPLNREYEYSLNESYINFLIDEMVPFMEEKYPIISAADKRAIMGISLGALSAAYTVVKHPEVFSLLGSQSGVYYIDDYKVIKIAKEKSLKITRGYFDVGIYEEFAMESTEEFVEVLRANGNNILYKTGSSGHNWTLWGNLLGEGLKFLFPVRIN